MPVLPPDVLAGLLAPIPGANASGRDLRYDPRYDAVREARREDADLPQGAYAAERKLADWPRVQRDTTALLTKESKDLQLAAWLTEALLKRLGLRGLEDGLTLVTGLLTEYWDTLYPELEDGDAELRLGPVEWIGSRLNIPVRAVAVAPDGMTLLEWGDAQSVPSEKDASNADKKKLRDAKLAEGKRAPEAAQASIVAGPKAFYKELVAASQGALAALDALEQVAEERFADDPPSLRPLRVALGEVLHLASTTLAQKLVVDPDPPPEEVAPEVVDGPASDGAVTPSADVDGNGQGVVAAGPPAAEPTSAADAGARVVGAARYLRRQDATAPAPYLMLRALRWGELRATPGRVDARLLEAAPVAARTRLKGLLLEGNWTELLEQSEQVMATPAGRGWLDLQRYTLTACARLGASYAPVAAAVRGELASLLAAVPQLPEMTLMDDTPTANGETLDWLVAESLDGAVDAGDGADSKLPDGSAALAGALTGEQDGDLLAEVARGGAARRAAPRRRRLDGRSGLASGDGADAFQLARAELARGRPNRAVELLVSELDRERSARGRFVRETQIAQVMVEAGLAEVARPILRRLVDTIKEKSLETWESGALVAQPLVLMCRVMDALGVKDAEREELYLRVCRLDPLQAMALKKGA